MSKQQAAAPASKSLAERQACSILEEIAHRADLIDSSCFHVDFDGDREMLQIHLMRLRQDVTVIGALADQAVNKLGGSVGRNLEGWLLPSTYPSDEIAQKGGEA